MNSLQAQWCFQLLLYHKYTASPARDLDNWTEKEQPQHNQIHFL